MLISFFLNEDLHGRVSHANLDNVGMTVRQRQPEFTRRLRNLQFSLGTNIRLAASVLGQPPAVIVWQKDGRDISNELSRTNARISAKVIYPILLFK